MATPAWFDTGYYLTAKAMQLNQQNYNNKSDWTAIEVSNLLSSYGMNAYDHYLQYGASEGLNPNAYFDQNYYLQEKANQLNAQSYGSRSDWSASEVSQLFSSYGLTAYQHFVQYWAAEGLNPSACFSVQNYLQNKAANLNGNGSGQWNAANVLSALESAGLDPVSHFMLYGKTEGLSPSSGTGYALTAFYDSYLNGVGTGSLTTLRLEGIAGSTVTATMSADATAAVTCSNPSTITSIGTNAHVWSIDASGVSGAGVILNGSSTGDILLGSAGDDVITGGQGFDIMQGRGGADTFVFHFGTTSQISDSCVQLDPSNVFVTSQYPDSVEDFTLGTDRFSFLTSAGTQVNPTAIYYAGTISVTENATTGKTSITYADGSSQSFTLSSMDSIINFEQALYTAGVHDKNGALAGTTALGANEAVIWNVQTAYTYGSTTTTSTECYLAVNDGNATFNDQDLVISVGSSYTGAYDTTTGLISNSLLLG